MNVYVIEINASLKEENKDKRLVSTMSKWDGISPLYYINPSSFDVGTDPSKCKIFLDKRLAIKECKKLYKRNFSRIVINSLNILTIELALKTPLEVRFSQTFENNITKND